MWFCWCLQFQGFWIFKSPSDPIQIENYILAEIGLVINFRALRLDWQLKLVIEISLNHPLSRSAFLLKMHTLNEQYTLGPRAASNQKWHKIMYIEYNFRRGLFYAKMLNSKFFIWRDLQEHVWGALVPQGDLR